MEIKLIPGERALIIGDYLVIADLHLGYEKTIKERGYTIPNQRKAFAERIKQLVAKTNAKKLIILGDIKHNIPTATINEKYELPWFFREISPMFKEIVITKGNHDGLIEKMIHEDNVKIVKEFLLGEFVFVHGHSYPSIKAKNCKILVIGHVHPTFRIQDKAGTRHNYPCWVFGKINPKKIKRYKEVKWENVIVVPAFNQMLTGYETLTGPLAKSIKKEEILLLDLTKVK